MLEKKTAVKLINETIYYKNIMIQAFFQVKSVLKDLIVSRGHHSNDIFLLESKDYSYLRTLQ